jgi:hypothetical protein
MSSATNTTTCPRCRSGRHSSGPDILSARHLYYLWTRPNFQGALALVVTSGLDGANFAAVAACNKFNKFLCSRANAAPVCNLRTGMSPLLLHRRQRACALPARAYPSIAHRQLGSAHKVGRRASFHSAAAISEPRQGQQLTAGQGRRMHSNSDGAALSPRAAPSRRVLSGQYHGGRAGCELAAERGEEARGVGDARGQWGLG